MVSALLALIPLSLGGALLACTPPGGDSDTDSAGGDTGSAGGDSGSTMIDGDVFTTLDKGPAIEDGALVEIAPFAVGVEEKHVLERYVEGEPLDVLFGVFVTGESGVDFTSADVTSQGVELPVEMGDSDNLQQRVEFELLWTPRERNWSFEVEVRSANYPQRFRIVGSEAGALPTDQWDLDGDGTVAADDCNDEDPTIHPGAVEVCNGIDDDCDGDIDEGVPTTRYYVDADEDGYGDPDHFIDECSDVVEGYTTDNTDCNDASAAIHPGAVDVVSDGIDSDCDGLDCQIGILDGATFGVCFDEFVWEDARALCTGAFGGDMASIRSAAEQQFVRELMIEAAMPYALIGLTDVVVEGTFEWTDGAALDYTNWGVGEPNDGGGGGGGELALVDSGEDCAAIQGDRDYTWNDVPCDLLTDSAVICGRR
ncbi:MAG: hypothetical protein H6742_00795 [Alphaproteobacteria bacterium]|nr:hypothetical protein [Alphaproteobacteria bacterium]